MPKGTTNRYSLRGMLSCGICGRTMQGAFRESRRKDGTGRVLYKCEPHQHRALPAEMQHPPSVYVSEDAILGPLNEWIEKLADPDVLAAGQAGDPGHVGRVAGLRNEPRDTQIEITKLIAFIGAGIDPALIAPQIATRRAERDRLERQIAAMNVEQGMSPAEIEAVDHELGGLRQDPRASVGGGTARGLRVAADQYGVRAGETPGQSPLPNSHQCCVGVWVGPRGDLHR